jgi:hypothetical protein
MQKDILPVMTEAHLLCLCIFSVGNALFEALSESVYSEVAALISSNENRPHFLIQLFRDLQMISSDPLRQRTLQSIQEIVSQYLANTIVGNHRQPLTDNQQLGEVSDNYHLLPLSISFVLKGSPPPNRMETASCCVNQYR